MVAGPPSPDLDRSFYLSPGFAGGGELSGRLDPAGFEVVEAAVAAAMTDDVAGEAPRTKAQRRADALVALCRSRSTTAIESRPRVVNDRTCRSSSPWTTSSNVLLVARSMADRSSP